MRITLGLDRMVTGPGNRTADDRARRIYLHIGEPKTGTTFLQDALWGNRVRLAAQGVRLPGYHDRDHSRASRDLRETPRPERDPADPWTGEWDVLAGQALRAGGRAVISNELLAAASPQQAGRALRSLAGAEVHVVATVRDFASLLPAEWQESVKCRGTVGWEAWLREVMAAEPAADRRRQSWFWRVHDTLAILGMWSQDLPPDRVHVITVPPRDAAGLLWPRFAGVLGADPGGCDLSGARRNRSLGLPETEFLRQLNQALPADMPDWFYIREIKQILAHGALGARRPATRPALPPGVAGWAAGQAETVISGLRDAGYHIAGDLAELRPAAPSAARPAAGAAAEPAELAAKQLEAAVQAAVALAGRYYQLRYPVRKPPQRRSARQRASDIKWVALNGRRVRRVLRRASHRPAVQRLRVIIWCVLTRPGRRPGQVPGD